jgi:hypothetical protein
MSDPVPGDGLRSLIPQQKAWYDPRNGLVWIESGLPSHREFYLAGHDAAVPAAEMGALHAGQLLPMIPVTDGAGHMSQIQIADLAAQHAPKFFRESETVCSDLGCEGVSWPCATAALIRSLELSQQELRDTAEKADALTLAVQARDIGLRHVNDLMAVYQQQRQTILELTGDDLTGAKIRETFGDPELPPAWLAHDPALEHALAIEVRARHEHISVTEAAQGCAQDFLPWHGIARDILTRLDAVRIYKMQLDGRHPITVCETCGHKVHFVMQTAGNGGAWEHYLPRPDHHEPVPAPYEPDACPGCTGTIAAHSYGCTIASTQRTYQDMTADAREQAAGQLAEFTARATQYRELVAKYRAGMAAKFVETIGAFFAGQSLSPAHGRAEDPRPWVSQLAADLLAVVDFPLPKLTGEQ